jgi:hypothetical protein
VPVEVNVSPESLGDPPSAPPAKLYTTAKVVNGVGGALSANPPIVTAAASTEKLRRTIPATLACNCFVCMVIALLAI